MKKRATSIRSARAKEGLRKKPLLGETALPCFEDNVMVQSGGARAVDVDRARGP